MPAAVPLWSRLVASPSLFELFCLAVTSCLLHRRPRAPFLPCLWAPVGSWP